MDHLDQEHQELIANLDELAALLRAHDVRDWAEWLDHDYGALVELDATALDHLLQAYGGMGSLNDLIIHPVNGHAVVTDMIDPVNERLSALRSAVHQLATSLRR